MKEQIEDRLVVLRGILDQRNKALNERQVATATAVAERDFIVGAIAELKFLLEQEKVAGEIADITSPP